MLLAGFAVQREGTIDEIQRLVEPALSPTQRGLQVEDLGPDLDVPRGAPGQAVLRLDERVLGASELAENPARVAEMSEAPGAQVHHPIRIVRLAEMTDDPKRQVRELHPMGRIAERGLPALPEEELAEAPGVQILTLLHLPELLGVGTLGEMAPELRSLPALGHGDLRVPMTDLLLQAQDLRVPFPANRTARQEVRDHEAEDLVVLQGPREPLGQRLFRQMGIFHSGLPPRVFSNLATLKSYSLRCTPFRDT